MYKNKWDLWYNAQPPHIQQWIDQPRAIWYDRDMFKAFAVGIAIGIIVGLIF